jgi:hypothetical protein
MGNTDEDVATWGELREGLHVAGYTFERACTRLVRMLEGDGWKVGGRFKDINAFLASLRASTACGPRQSNASASPSVSKSCNRVQATAISRERWALVGALSIGTSGQMTHPQEEATRKSKRKLGSVGQMAHPQNSAASVRPSWWSAGRRRALIALPKSRPTSSACCNYGRSPTSTARSSLIRPGSTTG